MSTSVREAGERGVLPPFGMKEEFLQPGEGSGVEGAAMQELFLHSGRLTQDPGARAMGQK